MTVSTLVDKFMSSIPTVFNYCIDKEIYGRHVESKTMEREREREREMTKVQLIHQHLTCTHSFTETYKYFSSYRNVGINCVI